MRRLVCLSILLLVATPACSLEGSSDPLDDEPLTAAELGWVRGYSAWAIELGDEDVSSSSSEAARDCEDRLDRIGEPPSQRLEPAAERARDVCPLLSEPGTRRRALDFVDEADELVLPYMRDQQPLELRSGVSTESRADVGMSEDASDVIGSAVEVRCWDEPDWERVIGEDNAWNDVSESHLDLVGWTAEDVDRIHLVLEICNTISRVVDGDDIDSWSRSAQIDVADAIETFSHEIQHFVRPDASEAEVECAAIRSLPRFAQRFGVPTGLARTLEELYRAEVYRQLDDEYTRGGCPRRG